MLRYSIALLILSLTSIVGAQTAPVDSSSSNSISVPNSSYAVKDECSNVPSVSSSQQVQQQAFLMVMQQNQICGKAEACKFVIQTNYVNATTQLQKANACEEKNKNIASGVIPTPNLPSTIAAGNSTSSGQVSAITGATGSANSAPIVPAPAARAARDMSSLPPDISPAE